MLCLVIRHTAKASLGFFYGIGVRSGLGKCDLPEALGLVSILLRNRDARLGRHRGPFCCTDRERELIIVRPLPSVQYLLNLDLSRSACSISVSNYRDISSAFLSNNIRDVFIIAGLIIDNFHIFAVYERLRLDDTVFGIDILHTLFFRKARRNCCSKIREFSRPAVRVVKSENRKFLFCPLLILQDADRIAPLTVADLLLKFHFNIIAVASLIVSVAPVLGNADIRSGIVLRAHRITGVIDIP